MQKCKTICRSYAQKKFYSSHWFKNKEQIFLLFSKVKIMQIMQKYVGLVHVTWRQFFRLFNFSEIFTKLLWNINDSNSAKKSKNFFLRQKFKKKIK